MILYTDFDPCCCAWITELIRMGEIPPGEVWCKPIQEIQSHELSRFHQVHLFAGVAGWARAGRLAGLGRDAEWWSCSCPCPPFSSAAKKKECPKCGGRPFPCPWLTGYFTCGECDHSWLADERHLWPEPWRLIAQCRPPKVAGEQVASDDGLIWLAGVRATLEIAGYGLGACDYPAAGVASPNLRQRIFWVASPAGAGSLSSTHAGICGGEESLGSRDGESERCGVPSGMGLPDNARPQGQCVRGNGSGERIIGTPGVGFWSNFTVIPCGDGKQRRIESGTLPLVNGLPGKLVRGGDPGAPGDEVSEAEALHTAEARVMRLRGYGNAINPYVAARFLNACGLGEHPDNPGLGRGGVSEEEIW